jgi:hypothetical protein
LISDSVGEVEYDREYDVSSYPQEQGAFESYNKVQIPYSAKISLLSSQTRQQLLSTIEPIVASLQLVTIVMPEWGYANANLLRYNFRRTVKSGVTLIVVDVWCKEIRFGASITTAPPGAGSQQSSGSTGSPVGQVNVKVPATGQESGFGGAATGTGSTNAAYPTQSGPVQPFGFHDFQAAGIIPSDAVYISGPR